MGSRLHDLTKELPKPLIDVNGKSILERQILSFKKFGIDKIVIIRGPHREKFSFKNDILFIDIEYIYFNSNAGKIVNEKVQSPSFINVIVAFDS